MGRISDLESVDWLWIVTLCLCCLAVPIIVFTGFFINRTRLAKVKLEVAIEALLASSCENPEHQLRRSDLLNRCGYPSVEVTDTNIVTAASLQDENNGTTLTEYGML